MSFKVFGFGLLAILAISAAFSDPHSAPTPAAPAEAAAEPDPAQSDDYRTAQAHATELRAAMEDQSVIEPRAAIPVDMKGWEVNAVLFRVQREGYTCDSVTWINRNTDGTWVGLACDHMQHRFELNQLGGKWSVEATK